MKPSARISDREKEARAGCVVLLWITWLLILGWLLPLACWALGDDWLLDWLRELSLLQR